MPAARWRRRRPGPAAGRAVVGEPGRREARVAGHPGERRARHTVAEVRSGSAELVSRGAAGPPREADRASPPRCSPGARRRRRRTGRAWHRRAGPGAGVRPGRAHRRGRRGRPRALVTPRLRRHRLHVHEGRAGRAAHRPRCSATAQAPTTLDDVVTGVLAATAGLPDAPVVACSSAGGGLRLAVVGYEELISAEAGHRAALSAGARVVHVAAGRLDDAALAALRRRRPGRRPAGRRHRRRRGVGAAAQRGRARRRRTGPSRSCWPATPPSATRWPPCCGTAGCRCARPTTCSPTSAGWPPSRRGRRSARCSSST